MDDPNYIPMYDSNGNEIWVNPEISDSELNQLLENTPKDKYIEVVAKPTYLIYIVAGAFLLLLYWFKFKRK